MKPTIMLKSQREERNSFTIDSYTEIFLSQDKKFCSTNSRLHLFAEKLKIHWSGPFVVHTIFSYGAVKFFDPKDGKIFKVNGQRLKSFFAIKPESQEEKVMGLLTYFMSD